jgi:hypothetical protein
MRGEYTPFDVDLADPKVAGCFPLSALPPIVYLAATDVPDEMLAVLKDADGGLQGILTREYHHRESGFHDSCPAPDPGSGGGDLPHAAVPSLLLDRAHLTCGGGEGGLSFSTPPTAGPSGTSKFLSEGLPTW